MLAIACLCLLMGLLHFQRLRSYPTSTLHYLPSNFWYHCLRTEQLESKLGQNSKLSYHNKPKKINDNIYTIVLKIFRQYLQTMFGFLTFFTTLRTRVAIRKEYKQMCLLTNVITKASLSLRTRSEFEFVTSYTIIPCQLSQLGYHSSLFSFKRFKFVVV